MDRKYTYFYGIAVRRQQPYIKGCPVMRREAQNGAAVRFVVLVIAGNALVVFEAFLAQPYIIIKLGFGQQVAVCAEVCR